jgi:hypothetical protein
MHAHSQDMTVSRRNTRAVPMTEATNAARTRRPKPPFPLPELMTEALWSGIACPFGTTGVCRPVGARHKTAYPRLSKADGDLSTGRPRARRLEPMYAISAIAEPRTARVGDRLRTADLGPRPARRLAATGLLVPGRGGLDGYRFLLDSAAEDFAAWDGVVVATEADDEARHRLLVVDRYRQVYAVYDATDADGLPGTSELREWFRFLATACPECGVLDDLTRVGPTP